MVGLQDCMSRPVAECGDFGKEDPVCFRVGRCCCGCDSRCRGLDPALCWLDPR